MKKKYILTAAVYAVESMAAGIFYREYTKALGYTGGTVLADAHGHLFMLGTVVFLLVTLFSHHMDLEKEKSFWWFLRLYNIGVPLTSFMMIVRGITQVREQAVSIGVDAMISGFAGIGHILTGIGILCLLRAMYKQAED